MTIGVRTLDFDFDLPAELIAQAPLPRRDDSRLLVIDRRQQRWQHHCFSHLVNWLNPGDVLVLNDSRVIPARLRGIKPASGGQFEILLLEESQPNQWWVLLKPGKRVRAGTVLQFCQHNGQASPLHARVLEKNLEGHYLLQFEGTTDLLRDVESLGEIPLPPYITRRANADGIDDHERYQTVYACPPGSVAAPTAGLHFTPVMLDRIRQHGVQVCSVTLHVGLGTFAPVKTSDLAQHPMHAERFKLGEETAKAIRLAKRNGHRVFAVGTTSVRVLESVAAAQPGGLEAMQGRTRIFIHPPYPFRIVDGLLTNFHLPRSTLLMLVSAFASPGSTTGRSLVLAAYAEAVRLRYRFFSYGDAMLLI